MTGEPFVRGRHTLDEARRQVLVAVDLYDRPGDRRGFNDFFVHARLAWPNLLQADRIDRNDLEAELGKPAARKGVGP